MVKGLIFMGGMLVGGAVATVVLCCVMINGYNRNRKKK